MQEVVGSIPTGSTSLKALVAQSVERILGKDEVTGSTPVVGTSFKSFGDGARGRGSGIN